MRLLRLAPALLLLTLVPLTAGAEAATCVPTSGGLDYPSWLCVDPKSPRCAVYTITTSDAGVRKTCVGPGP